MNLEWRLNVCDLVFEVLLKDVGEETFVDLLAFKTILNGRSAGHLHFLYGRFAPNGSLLHLGTVPYAQLSSESKFDSLVQDSWIFRDKESSVTTVILFHLCHVPIMAARGTHRSSRLPTTTRKGRLLNPESTWLLDLTAQRSTTDEQSFSVVL